MGCYQDQLIKLHLVPNVHADNLTVPNDKCQYYRFRQSELLTLPLFCAESSLKKTLLALISRENRNRFLNARTFGEVFYPRKKTRR